MRRAAGGLAAMLLIGLILVGCAPAATAPAPSPSATAPSPKPSALPTPALSPVEEAVAQMTLAEQAASVVMGTVGGTDAATLRAFMSSGPDGAPLGGFILMGDNIAGDETGRRAVADALTLDPKLPPLIAIDQEGGPVSRLPEDRLPGGRRLHADDAAQTETVFAQRARMVAAAGANLNFGIVADVPVGDSFISSRALGTNPASAAGRVAAAVRGEKGIVLSTLKHFPGHGAAAGDSHVSIPHTPMSLTDWRASAAVPFLTGVEAGAEVLMFGHLAYTAVDAAPASLSPAWHEIARRDLGFTGVMITDDLGMLTSSGVAAYRDPPENAVSAIASGNDMVLMIAGSTPTTAGELAQAIVQAVSDGRIQEARLQDAAEHVMALRMHLAAGAG